MNTTDPADLSPLSYGTGLALGLMLIVGLPRATDLPPTAHGEDLLDDLHLPIPGAGPGELRHCEPVPTSRHIAMGPRS